MATTSKKSKKQQVREFLQANEEVFSSIKDAVSAFSDEFGETNYTTFNIASQGYFKPNTLTASMNKSNHAPLPTDEVIDFVDIKKLSFSDDILIPTKAGCALDDLMSSSGGVMPATIMIVPGESGIGKSTVLLDYVGRIKAQYPEKDILYVSTEMNRIHMYKYGKRINVTGIDLVFLGEYQNSALVLEKVFKQGWDIIILDSFQDAVDKCRESLNVNLRQAESFLLRLMDKVRLAENDKQKYTTFMCTQHMTKGAQYTGSTNLKHMTDSMLDLRRDKEMPEYTYLEFSKNRDGRVWVRQYFQVTNSGVEYIGQPAFDNSDNEDDDN